MTHSMVELIGAKRDGRQLDDDQIAWIIDRYTADAIPDYQMSALLMAIVLRGMSASELGPWTEAMLHSGETLDLASVDKPKVDKHSTGGVGDKTSLVLTPLAVACGVEALLEERVRRILLVRPAVEAGEKLGFLPGDLAEKIDPYLRPLYDALYEMLGFEKVAKLMDRLVIEVAPLAYMRGRTLNNSFVILDEAHACKSVKAKRTKAILGSGGIASSANQHGAGQAYHDL